MYNGIGNGLSTIWRTEGWKGLLSGWGVTILRDAPYAGLYIFFYNRFKPFVSTTVHEKNYCNFISGIGAGVVSTTICHPFDVIKTRVQLDNKMGNMWGAIKYMINNEHPSSFFSGYIVRGMRKVLSGAITWTVYEYCINRSN
jgi:solute carrier family 25 protein 38